MLTSNFKTNEQNKAVFSEENYVHRLQRMMTFSRSKNVFNSLLCFNDTIHKVWLESIIQFKRQKAETQFLSKFEISKHWCDLENKVKITKS